MSNQLKFLSEYSPYGLMKEIGRVGVKGEFNPKLFARGVEGSLGLTAAYGIRNDWFGSVGLHPGEKWYEVIVGGKIIDTRPFNPLSTFLWQADLVSKLGKGDWKKALDVAMDGWEAITGMRGVGILWTKEKLQNAFQRAAEGDESGWKTIGNYFKEVGGNFVGGFITPLTTVRDLVHGFQDFAVKDQRTKPFLGPIEARIENELPPRYTGTREAPQTQIMPAMRQLSGLAISPPRNEYEKELERVGFDRRKYLTKTGDGEIDNLIAKNTGWMAEKIAPAVLNSDGYKKAPDDIKKIILEDMAAKIKTAGMKMTEATRPDMAMKIKIKQIPESHREMLRNKGIDLNAIAEGLKPKK
jgi:hypothetical protein